LIRKKNNILIWRGLGLARVSSGLIIAGAYANKLRRVMFATLKGKIDNKEVARATGELNALLFELFREVGVEKGDVVRITIEYEIENGKIKWKWDALEVQHYKPVEETSTKIKELLPKVLEKREELVAKPALPMEIEVEYLGTVKEGLEDVYVIKAPKEETYVTIGAIRVLFRNEVGEALSIIVTPEGRAFRYLMKLKYSPDPLEIAKNVKEELVKALSENRVEEIDREKAKEMLKELIKVE